jgi:RNA polymerase sigma-70 factor (ECF subfamily)
MQGVLRTRKLTRGAEPAGEAGDAELVALAQADPRSFELLYRRYLNPVHRYCYRRLGSREAAEDATSVVFTKAFASLRSYREGSFRAWLFTIAHHAVADDLRTRRPTHELDVADDIPAREPSPEEIVVAADAQRAVTELLAQLPEGQRRVVELRMAGLSGREIAEVLGRGLPAVKIAQLRGYTRLRALLAAESGQEGGDVRL